MPTAGSQDHSRIFRLSYHDPVYVELAAAALERWRVAEDESGLRLLTMTGGLDVQLGETSGLKDVDQLAGSLDAQGIDHELIDGAELRQRWPQWQVPDNARALYQSESGIVDAARANATHISLARAHGATVIDETPVREIRRDGAGVAVVTDGETYRADRAVVAAGAWTNRLLGPLGIEWPLTVTQEQVTYFATPHLREFAPDRFPIWIWRGPQEFYGFPVYGEVATKTGLDAGGDEVTAESRSFDPNPRTHQAVVEFLERYLPRSLGPELYTKTCLYTMPPDRDFIIGPLPETEQVIVAVGAGHGYKFASVFGDILAEFVMTGATEHNVEPFRLDRAALSDPDFRSQIRNEHVFTA